MSAGIAAGRLPCTVFLSGVSTEDAQFIELTGTGMLARRPVGGIALLCAFCRRHVVFLLDCELSFL